MDTSIVETDFYTKHADGRVQCDMCPRNCKLNEGQRGLCFVRGRFDDRIKLLTYGRSSGFCIDPIEKKPLNHFLPGTSVLSLGTAGCNLGCTFCQNHDITKSREQETLNSAAMPHGIAKAALDLGCRSVAFTYNDPVIFHEYARDTAIACHEVGVKTVAVTAGYVAGKAREAFFEHIDAANVDLKAFSEDFYKKITKSELAVVLETLKYLKSETNVWFEITTLLIPDENDSEKELEALTAWVYDNLGADVPLHFSAFHPDYRMMDKIRTPHETLAKARRIGREAGLTHVYIGNIQDIGRQSTYCTGCGERVIGRDHYELSSWKLTGSACGFCGTSQAGVFEATPGDWGRKRQRVDMKKYA
jgi:pyruvate formate lyase activating enzyme